MNPFSVVVLPRVVMSWDEFKRNYPPNPIALDGVVSGGPNFDHLTKHINFDHHDHVVREATMCTAMQVMYAIKGGLPKFLTVAGRVTGTILINDTDPDSAFAVWLLMNFQKFEGAQSIPSINRLLELDSRWDTTGGAYPMNLAAELVRQHAWVFEPYTSLRKTCALANANAEIMRDNLEATMRRLDMFLMGQSGEVDLDTRHEILFDSAEFKIVREVGGSDARYLLFSRGMDAFISLVAERPDGRIVYSLGRRSRYINFPVPDLYSDLNRAEGFEDGHGWGGSDIVGGSHRSLGSGLTWGSLRDITLERLRKNSQSD